jgi:hypothetical protein
MNRFPPIIPRGKVWAIHIHAVGAKDIPLRRLQKWGDTLLRRRCAIIHATAYTP